MFGPVQTTRYDLRFPLFGIPVHVTPWFWLGGVFLGWGLINDERYDLLAIWLACLFVSILVHELGHALFAKAFGWPPEIYLYQFGGLAVFFPSHGYTTGRSVLVSLAGPGAGFVLYGILRLVEATVLSTEWFATLGFAAQLRLLFAFHQLNYINLWWGLVNLLPVLPLDGGRISETLLARFRPWDGRGWAIKLGIAVSAGVALYFASEKQNYPAIFFGLLCITNVQMLQQPRSPW